MSISDRARELLIRSRQLDGDQVLIEVEDSGIGIAPENMSQLFTAFYTTKLDGMGMGLSICRSLIEAHGGRIWAARNAGPAQRLRSRCRRPGDRRVSRRTPRPRGGYRQQTGSWSASTHSVAFGRYLIYTADRLCTTCCPH